MNFLAPWFLIGAVAIAGPILFHLIRRTSRDRVLFSSLMFLRPTPPRVTRRSRIEHWLLLLLRCLCLALLAACFARPFFARDFVDEPPSQDGRQMILLLDTSASMKREGVWEKARTTAEQRLNKTSAADQIAIVTFDRQPRTLVSFTEWNAWPSEQRTALARQRLSTVSPGWTGTQLGFALTTAAEQFRDEEKTGKPAARREIVVISDLQEGAKLDGLQGHEWPKGVKVSVERIESPKRNNAGLQFANESSEAIENTPRVRIVNAGDSRREQFRIGWSDGKNATGEPAQIYLPAGQSRTFPAPKLPGGTLATQLRLMDDDEEFDNVSWFIPTALEQITVLFFGDDAANDPAKLRYYLQRAFPETLRRRVRVVSPPLNSDSSAELNQAALAVIGGNLSAGQTTALRSWLANGKTALLIATETGAAPTLAALLGQPEIKVTEAMGNYALLGEIDFKHPLFAQFADPRFSDFTHVHFWKHRRLEIPASAQSRTLAKFDDGSPALAQFQIGKGNLLVLASGWQPADSQFALSTKFVPFLNALLDWSDSETAGRIQFEIGDSIPAPMSAASVQWQKPDGSQVTLAAGAPFTQTDVPGIYSATAGGKERKIAVNLPLEESRTAPIAVEELARLGVPLQTGGEISGARVEKQKIRLQQAELENRQKLWRWLILAVLAVTFVEIVLGGWFTRRAQPATP